MGKKNNKKKITNSVDKKEEIVENNESSDVASKGEETSKENEVFLEESLANEENSEITKETEKVIEKVEEITENNDNSLEDEVDEETNKDDSSYTVVETKKSHKGLFIVSFVLIALVVLLFIFSTAFALIASHQNTIISGITIKDIDVSGLSKEDAIKKVTDAFNEKLEEHITLKHNEYEIDVFLGQFDVSFSIEEAVNMAYEKGHMRKYFSK